MASWAFQNAQDHLQKMKFEQVMKCTSWAIFKKMHEISIEQICDFKLLGLTFWSSNMFMMCPRTSKSIHALFYLNFYSFKYELNQIKYKE